MRKAFPILIACFLFLSSGTRALGQPDPLPSWNAGTAKEHIVNFVQAVSHEGGPGYVPPSERIAVFDNDGTLWVEKPTYVQRRFVMDQLSAFQPRLIKKKSLIPQVESIRHHINSAMGIVELLFIETTRWTQVNRTPAEFDELVRQWLTTARHPRFNHPYTECVYAPMLELMDYLRENGFEIYIVSGGGMEFVRSWAESVYRIPPENVLGSSIKLRYMYRNGAPVLVRRPRINTIANKAGKPILIEQVLGRKPIAAFGNSDGDLQMLEWVTSGPGARLGLIVHHDDPDREYAYDRKTGQGRLDKALSDAPKKGWTVVSMKHDWKHVFPFEPLFARRNAPSLAGSTTTTLEK